MPETDLDIDFNPREFVVPTGWFIDGTFWEHIDENCSVPSSTSCKTRFYVPTARAKKGWPEKIKLTFNVEPWVVYDMAVLNLPNEITAEEIEEHRLNMNKYLVKSLKDPTPVGPPDKLSVREYLSRKSLSLQAFLCWGNRTFEDLSEKEKRICQWTEDYGFLWDHRDGEGLLFPHPKDDKALKFEVIKEYFFHLREFPQLILSVAQEPNTDKAVYGFRREGSLDWPFDKIWTGVEYDDNHKPRPRYLAMKDEGVEEMIIKPMNKLVRNIEYLLQKD